MRYRLEDLGGIVGVGYGDPTVLVYFTNQEDSDNNHVYCSCCGWIDPENPEAVKN